MSASRLAEIVAKLTELVTNDPGCIKSGCLSCNWALVHTFFFNNLDPIELYFLDRTLEKELNARAGDRYRQPRRGVFDQPLFHMTKEQATTGGQNSFLATSCGILGNHLEDNLATLIRILGIAFKQIDKLPVGMWQTLEQYAKKMEVYVGKRSWLNEPH